ncbi:hypothetical protein [Streptomyces sp. SID13726]|uniref:hypothetical protein n=1 Tax=Streptomyces sp. SID13726 TaxID=2706058 RepID=UPI0013B77342|nr:hypothetical protein [Streptomyces sp. SID13726]NEA98448.1 hypothetical protein [Streptomyces sp. SID13726]
MTHERDRERTPGEETAEVLTGGAGPSRLRGSWERRPVRARAVIAAATVGVLAVGGTVAYAATSDGTGDGTTAAASPTPAPTSKGPSEGHGPRFRLGGGGVHGEETVKDPDSGDWVVRVWQRGTVEKADGDQVTVRSEDGTAWTWTVGKDAKVLRDGESGSGADTFEKGDTVYLTGRLSDDATRSADLAVTGTGTGTGTGKDGWRGGFPGHGPRDWRHGEPTAPADPAEEGRAS